MKIHTVFLPAVFAAILFSVPSLALADVTVVNGLASQRAGTRLVDVYYGISGGAPPYTVTIEGSMDGGTTWTLPMLNVSGDVGNVASAGSNKRITWDAGTDWDGQFSPNVRFRVRGTDVPPAPVGFALIPAGSFTMGDQSIPLVGYSDELPVHTVYVSAFYMGKFEVTKALWDEVRAWGLNNGYTDLPTGSSKAANHPVQSINWYAMVKWCNARSQMDVLTPCYTFAGAVYKIGESDAVACNWSASGYRLPTEAEWEKAARGGAVGLNFPWGDTISHSQANYYSWGPDGVDASPTQGYHFTYAVDGYPYSSPVGSFLQNGYSLSDVVGNVSECCWDTYDGDYYTTSPLSDPRGPASGTYRVSRGGNWDWSYGSEYRLSCRDYKKARDTNSRYGFRLARGQP